MLEVLHKHGLSVSQFDAYVIKQKKLFEPEIHVHLAENISRDVWHGVEKILYSTGKNLHYKKMNDFQSFSAKTDTGIRYRSGYILWGSGKNELRFSVRIRNNDPYSPAVLGQPKYCMIVRRWHNNRRRYYVQVVYEGYPPERTVLANGGKVGIDIGPSTIAAVSRNNIVFAELGNGIDKAEREIARLNRKRDRQRRANNPQNFNENGTVKSGSRRWTVSHSEFKTKQKIRGLYQKRKNLLDYQHHCLVKRLLEMGDGFYAESMNWQALARKAKKTEVSEKTGRCKKKKRFGKSVANHAPYKLLSILAYKLKQAGCELHKVDTFSTKASQYNHITGEFKPAELNERWKYLDEDNLVQRDLYSAFLLQHVSHDSAIYDFASINNDYPDFKVMHDSVIAELKSEKANGMRFPPCMGI